MDEYDITTLDKLKDANIWNECNDGSNNCNLTALHKTQLREDTFKLGGSKTFQQIKSEQEKSEKEKLETIKREFYVLLKNAGTKDKSPNSKSPFREKHEDEEITENVLVNQETFDDSVKELKSPTTPTIKMEVKLEDPKDFNECNDELNSCNLTYVLDTNQLQEDIKSDRSPNVQQFKSETKVENGEKLKTSRRLSKLSVKDKRSNSISPWREKYEVEEMTENVITNQKTFDDSAKELKSPMKSAVKMEDKLKDPKDFNDCNDESNSCNLVSILTELDINPLKEDILKSDTSQNVQQFVSETKEKNKKKLKTSRRKSKLSVKDKRSNSKSPMREKCKEVEEMTEKVMANQKTFDDSPKELKSPVKPAVKLEDELEDPKDFNECNDELNSCNLTYVLDTNQLKEDNKSDRSPNVQQFKNETKEKNKKKLKTSRRRSKLSVKDKRSNSKSPLLEKCKEVEEMTENVVNPKAFDDSAKRLKSPMKPAMEMEDTLKDPEDLNECNDELNSSELIGILLNELDVNPLKEDILKSDRSPNVQQFKSETKEKNKEKLKTSRRRSKLSVKAKRLNSKSPLRKKCKEVEEITENKPNIANPKAFDDSAKGLKSPRKPAMEMEGTLEDPKAFNECNDESNTCDLTILDKNQLEDDIVAFHKSLIVQQFESETREENKEKLTSRRMSKLSVKNKRSNSKSPLHGKCKVEEMTGNVIDDSAKELKSPMRPVMKMEGKLKYPEVWDEHNNESNSYDLTALEISELKQDIFELFMSAEDELFEEENREKLETLRRMSKLPVKDKRSNSKSPLREKCEVEEMIENIIANQKTFDDNVNDLKSPMKPAIKMKDKHEDPEDFNDCNDESNSCNITVVDLNQLKEYTSDLDNSIHIQQLRRKAEEEYREKLKSSGFWKDKLSNSKLPMRKKFNIDEKKAFNDNAKGLKSPMKPRIRVEDYDTLVSNICDESKDEKFNNAIIMDSDLTIGDNIEDIKIRTPIRRRNETKRLPKDKFKDLKAGNECSGESNNSNLIELLNKLKKHTFKLDRLRNVQQFRRSPSPAIVVQRSKSSEIMPMSNNSFQNTATPNKIQFTNSGITVTSNNGKVITLTSNIDVPNSLNLDPETKNTLTDVHKKLGKLLHL